MSEPKKLKPILLFSSRWERVVTSFYAGFFILLCSLAPIVSLPALAGEETGLYFQVSELTILSGGQRHLFRVEIADTPERRSRGLMERRYMASDAGMLFDFSGPRIIRMWMKNTYIPLDMLFIDGTGRIVGIAAHTTPHSLVVISSPVPAVAVLEVNAGVAEKLGITLGDRIVHAIFQP